MGIGISAPNVAIDLWMALVQFLFFYYLQWPLDGGVYQYNCLVKSQKKGTAPPQYRGLEAGMGVPHNKRVDWLMRNKTTVVNVCVILVPFQSEIISEGSCVKSECQ